MKTTKYTYRATLLVALYCSAAAQMAIGAVESNPQSGSVVDKPTLADLFPMQPPAETVAAEPGYGDPVKVDEGMGRSRISGVPGESIDPRTGALQLTAEDLVIRGNGGLNLVVSRTRRSSFYAGQSDTYVSDGSIQELLGDWTLDIPNIELRSVYDYRQGSTVRWHSPLSNDLRHIGGLVQGACTAPYPPHPSYRGETTGGPNYSPNLLSYIGSIQLKGLSGEPERELLIRTEQQTRYLSSRYATSDQWIVECAGNDRLAAAGMSVNGQFIVSAPDGTTYYFDEPTKGNNLAPSATYPIFGKMRVFVSRIVDRNGNWIQYEYDDTLFSDNVLTASGYGRPTPDLRDYAYVKRIHTSDGREVTFNWELNPFVPGGSSACRGNEFGTCGSPRYRLKQLTHGKKIWQYLYNDEKAGLDSSRYLSAVMLPNGQSYQYRASAGELPANLQGCLGYPYSGTAAERLSPINYQVTFPGGAVVDYAMTVRLFERRSDNSGSCWYSTAVKSRRVDSLAGKPALTQWCYGPANRSGTSLWTYVLQPTRWEAFNFEREGSDGGWWGEGQLGSHQVRDALTQCPAGVGDPGAGYLRKTTSTYLRGDVISSPTNTSSTYAPGYAAAVVAPRSVERVTSDEPGSGVFESSSAQFDHFRFPRLTRESLAGQSSSAVGARRWKTEYDHRAVRFDLNVNINRALGYWFAPGYSGVEFWASRNGGPEFLVHSGGSSSNGEETFNVANFVPGQGTFTFAMYPAGQHSPERKLIEYRDLVVKTADIQRPRIKLWQLGRPIERCLVASDAAACGVVGGIAQSERAFYDLRGNKTGEIRYGKTSGFTYTSEGDVESQIDPNNKVMTLSSYKRGIPQEIALPSDGKLETESMAVNDDGSVARIVNPAGVPTAYTYDGIKRLKTVDYFRGADTAIVWSADGRKRTATRGNLEIVSQFDGFGRLVRQSTRDVARTGTVTTDYEYDEAGRSVFESYPALGSTGASNGLRHEYDALDREVRIVRTSDQAFSTLEFQTPEKQLSRDFAGRLTTRTYRSYGSPSYEQLLRVDQPYTAKDENGAVMAKTVTTTFDSDALGFVRSVTQGGVTRRYALDGRRLMTQEFAPELGQTPTKNGYNIGYCRDDVGQITGKTIGSACTNPEKAGLVENRYDARNRKIEVDYRDSASPDLGIGYTPTGKVSTTAKGGTATAYFYDEMEKLRREQHRIDSQVFTLRYSYDDLNNLASITYPSGKRYTVVNDAFGRVREIPGILSAVDYYPTGQIRTMTYQNGQTTTVGLTADNQPDTLVTRNTGGTLVSLDYGYDVNGNTTSLADLVKPEQSLATIGYDELNRLTETRYTTTSQIYRRGYDDTGNVRFDQTPELPLLYFSYDETNRLSKVSGSLSRSLNYDELGNIESDGERNLTFGYDGNLMHASTGSMAKTLSYDGRDRLLREDGPTGAIYYVYSGEHLMLEYYPAQKKYTEYLYAGSLLISSRTVENANLADADGDGVSDMNEFIGMGQPAD